MELIMSIINLMVVPFVGVIVHFRRNNIEMRTSMKVLAFWIVFMVTNIPSVHIILVILSRIIGGGIDASSAMYTIFATIVAFIQPYVLQIIRKYLELKIKLRFDVEAR